MAGMRFDLEYPQSIAEDLDRLMKDFARETSRELPWEPHTAASIQAKGYLVFTVRDEGSLVGFCLVRSVRDGAIDAGMYLLPEHRRGWIAVRFAQFVERTMGQLGARWMTWECDEASGSKAIADYLNHKIISRRYYVALSGGSE